MGNSSPEHDFYEPDIDLKLYRLELCLLSLALATPILTLLICRTGIELQRSGGVMDFFAVVAEFITLNRANTKHMRNASRAWRGEQPWDFSKPGKVVGMLALIAALVGTLLWVFGDLLLPTP